MTLAAILLNVLLIPLVGLVTPPAQVSTQSSDQSKSAQEQAQPNPPAQQAPSQQASPTASEPAPSSTTPSQKQGDTGQKPASKPKTKKKVLLDNCNPVPANGTPAAAANAGDKNGANSPADPSANSSNGSASNASASNGAASGSSPSNSSASNGSASNGSAPPPAAPTPTNCPPKVVVKQGGTSEPAIQLVGGTPSAPDRNTAIQMLQTAEENLKKINGQQLSSSQKDMVTQVRQFMDQSKTATAAGDLERARTLAWKAQTLSEELANPQR